MAARKRPECVECNRPTGRIHPILNIPVCSDCRRRVADKYEYISKTRAKETYRLKEADLLTLKVHIVDNPHYKVAAPMQLYLHSQVKILSTQKWGSSEPYIVSLVEFSPDQLRWLNDDLERIKLLDPRRFQFLIADRLEQMGLSVQLMGDTYRKDGGIDIIAYPNNCAIPFLLGVQAKHHRKNLKTPVSDVRDLLGTISGKTSPFQIGMIVTNTEFTPDANWIAEHNNNLIRLRDVTALGRWLRNDFVNEHEWREIPDHIEIGLGIKIPLLKQRVILGQNK